MPIKIPESLPAFSELEKENIFVMDEKRAFTQDIRPLRIAILNLMPTKFQTEIQLMRLLSNTPLQIDITLVRPSNHVSKNTSLEYLNRFYRKFSEIEDQNYDGLIITGAPVELIDYEEVDYWDELCRIFDWAESHVFSTMYICWAALAGLYHRYGIKKEILPEKRSGIFEYRNNLPMDPLMRAIDTRFMMPQSRNATVDPEEVSRLKGVRIAASSADGDIGIAISDLGDVFITGHLEYDRDTLDTEYIRDLNKGMNPHKPTNYYDSDDRPDLKWRCYATMIFTNWINYYVYQRTPYDIRDVSKFRGLKRNE